MTIALAETPILTVKCEEPEGVVFREIRPMAITPQNLVTFWEKARKFRTLFTDDINGDFKKFVETFMSEDSQDNVQLHGLFWVIDDFVGVFYITNMTRSDALVHYTFFDGRHKGRLELTSEMLKFVFGKYKFRRLSVEIPMYGSPHTFNFVINLGFKKEGRKRKAVLYKNEWFDVACFGLLPEEIWDHNTEK